MCIVIIYATKNEETESPEEEGPQTEAEANGKN
jgi:hypothetical protein